MEERKRSKAYGERKKEGAGEPKHVLIYVDGSKVKSIGMIELYHVYRRRESYRLGEA
jgi:hypothetical protein